MTGSPLARMLAQRGRAWLSAAPDPDELIDMAGDDLGDSTSEALRAATNEALGRHLGDHYTRRPGVAALCKLVAAQLAAEGLALSADDGVVISGGVQEARFVALRALAPGRTIWLPRPAPLPAYADAARFAGAPLALFDPDGPLPAAAGGLLLLPNPNPATGQCYAPEAAALLAQWAASGDMLAIADECAAPLLRPGLPFTRLAALPTMAARTLTIGSFAHIPGLDAWQVAWFAGQKAIAGSVRDLKQAMTICSPAVSQYAALAGCSGDRAVAEHPAQARQEAIAALLDRLSIPYAAPHTVAYLVANASRLGGGASVAAACAEAGVRVADGAAFGASDLFRITAAAPRFDEALARLEAGLRAAAQETTQ